jgi:hypothetical protein
VVRIITAFGACTTTFIMFKLPGAAMLFARTAGSEFGTSREGAWAKDQALAYRRRFQDHASPQQRIKLCGRTFGGCALRWPVEPWLSFLYTPSGLVCTAEGRPEKHLRPSAIVGSWAPSRCGSANPGRPGNPPIRISQAFRWSRSFCAGTSERRGHRSPRRHKRGRAIMKG